MKKLYSMKTEESIQIIEEMIATAKRDLSYNGFYFMIWGYLVFAAGIIHTILLTMVETDYHWVAWPILMTAGGITTGIYSARHQRKVKVRSHVDTFMTYLWGAFVISLFLVLFLMGSTEFPNGTAANTYFVVLLLYGIGTFVSGGALKFKPLVFGGVFCWICAIATLYSPYVVQLLILSLAVLVAYIVPGHLLLAKYRKHV